ncbi:hypothetical protein B7463_g8585, partial [Scytalidium lignicola]
MKYRGFTYAKVQVRLQKEAKLTKVCLDSSCSTTLADKEFLTTQLKDKLQIRIMAMLLTVQGIAGNSYKTAEYAIIDIRIPSIESGKSKDHHAKAVIQKEVHIVDKLQANMLISIDVMVPEEMILDLGNKQLHISSCNVTANVTVRQCARLQAKPVHARSTTLIPLHSIVQIPIHQAIHIDQDYIFKPDNTKHLTTYTQVLNCSTPAILAHNYLNQAVKVQHNACLSHLQELKCEHTLITNAFYNNMELLEMAK